MANASVSGLKYNFVTLTSLDGERSIDITNSILHSDYYEDILSPCVTMSIVLMNSTSLYNFLPLRGGESVNFSISTYSGDFTLDDDFTMYVFKVSDINPKDTNEFFTIHLISREGLTNETTRCLKKYTGNIKVTVEDILENDLKTTKFLTDNIERSANSYSFIGNTRKPFRILTWLGTKANPISSSGGGTSGSSNEDGEAKGTAGFFFWENKEGFNFKSIESLVSGTQIGSSSSDDKEIYKYFYSGATEAEDSKNSFRVLNYNIEKNIDLLKSLRVGMYSNKTYFYEYYTGICEVYTYKLKEQIQNTLGAANDIALSDSFGDSWTRLMVRIADTGVLDNDGVTTPSGRDKADMAKSASRYNLLFTQALNMVVPCNINLKSGDVIYVEFPKIELKKQKSLDEEQSGNYLIKELRHHFEGNNMLTSLKLVRDSYGVYG